MEVISMCRYPKDYNKGQPSFGEAFWKSVLSYIVLDFGLLCDGLKSLMRC